MHWAEFEYGMTGQIWGISGMTIWNSKFIIIKTIAWCVLKFNVTKTIKRRKNLTYKKSAFALGK